MRLNEITGLNEDLRSKLKVAITHLSQTGIASGVAYNGGLRISVHDNNYVELILRYVNPSSAPTLANVQRRLEECGLRLESNCTRGYNKPEGEPGCRWEEAYEVGSNINSDRDDIEISSDPELVEGVNCIDYRARKRHYGFYPHG